MTITGEPIDTLFRDVEVAGRRLDVRVSAGIVTDIDERLSDRGSDQVVDGAGGALIPGLWDHHVHLAAIAAADTSVDLAGVNLDQGLLSASEALDPAVPLRAVGYDEGDHGYLDRARLDAVVSDRPVRVQHRSGALWVCNSMSLRAAGLDVPDGRIFRDDDRLATPGDDNAAPDVAAVARRLASYGVTGVTDATPSTDPARLDLLVDATPWCDVVAMTGPELAQGEVPERLGRGPVKIVLSDHDLPDLDDVVTWTQRAHAVGRAVALHCVTDTALALAVAALATAGADSHPCHTDRIEHGSVIPTTMIPELARSNLTVVTQPGFVCAHGDRYLRDVESPRRTELYRCGSLLDQGVAVAGSSDAPYGPEDLWVAIAGAIERRAASGVVIGRDERLVPHAALGLFLGAPGDPGGAPRAVRPGCRADLCLLDAPLETVLATPARTHVVATFVGGAQTYTAG